MTEPPGARPFQGRGVIQQQWGLNGSAFDRALLGKFKKSLAL